MKWLAAILMLAWPAQLPAQDISAFDRVTYGHYQVLAQSGAEMGTQVNGFMNQMLPAYSRFFSNWSLKDSARVVVFDNLDDFRAYSTRATGMTHASLAGYCHLKTDEDGNTFYELVTYEHDRLWQVLAHEGFHQFLGYELGQRVPVWLNEGLAQYFETSSVSNRRLQTGAVSKNTLRAAQYLIKTRQAPPVAELLTMDRVTFYANAQVAYPMSWALAHYLLNRDDATLETIRGSTTFRRYLQDLKMNRDSVASFQRRFGRDSTQWQRDFERYVLQLDPQVD